MRSSDRGRCRRSDHAWSGGLAPRLDGSLQGGAVQQRGRRSPRGSDARNRRAGRSQQGSTDARHRARAMTRRSAALSITRRSAAQSITRVIWRQRTIRICGTVRHLGLSKSGWSFADHAEFGGWAQALSRSSRLGSARCGKCPRRSPGGRRSRARADCGASARPAKGPGRGSRPLLPAADPGREQRQKGAPGGSAASGVRPARLPGAMRTAPQDAAALSRRVPTIDRRCCRARHRTREIAHPSGPEQKMNI